jgi:hypothetical protein
MKVSSSVNFFLTNKYVLYFVLFLTFTNFVGYVMVRNLNAILLFIIFGLIAFYFSKNLVVVLGSAILLTNLFALNVNKKEGFDQPTDKPTKKTDDSSSKENKHDNSEEVLHSSIASSNEVPEANQAGFEVGRPKKGSKIDYASTIKDAYSQLNELIGSDGIKNLTNDTQVLMKQQLQLAESMKSMTPLIEGITPLLSQAQGMLGNIDQGTMNNLASIAKGFSASSASIKK